MKTMLAVFSALALALVIAGAMPALLEAKEAKFIGVDGCARCHKKDKEGRQVPIWEKSKHAEAFKNLGTDEAKKRAQKVGVSGDPQKSEACLVCHVAGLGEPDSRFDKKFAMEDGVQCESCHGAGGEYKSKKIMKEISDERGPDKKGKSATAEQTGLVIPNENTCKQCHALEIQF